MAKVRSRSKKSLLLTIAQRQAIAALKPEWALRLKVDEKLQRKIPFLVDEIKSIQELALKSFGESGRPSKPTPMTFVYDIATQAIHDLMGIEVIPVESRIYQFRIAITGSRPAIWRRIQVPESTLHQLHLWIYAVMGWSNQELYRFVLNGLCFCDPRIFEAGRFDPTFMFDASKYLIQRIVPRNGKRYVLQYIYDYDDYWDHELIFEECCRANPDIEYPICLEGDLPPPPEKMEGSMDTTIA